MKELRKEIRPEEKKAPPERRTQSRGQKVLPNSKREGAAVLRLFRCVGKKGLLREKGLYVVRWGSLRSWGGGKFPTKTGDFDRSSGRDEATSIGAGSNRKGRSLVRMNFVL